MVTRQGALRWLRAASGSEVADFREGQWETIQRLVQHRRRVLLVQRTGWGKSLVYFVATRLFRNLGVGPTLIISPLLSLMRNQQDAAVRLRLSAETINGTNREAWPVIIRKVRENKVDVLLVSPERLAKDDFLQECLLPIAESIAFFVVDEAHCISDWGHDFRPDYQRINRILARLPPNVAVLATTATANDRVVKDVLGQLGQETDLRRGPLARTSLRLQNIALPDRAARLAWLADNLPRLPGSGIIYTLTVRDADQVAAWLTERKINASAYHSQLDGEGEAGDTPDLRTNLETRLLNNNLKALVATSALGMGFDKPDLGFVIHFQSPQSVVHYYQQVGRAGRAINEAFGLLFRGQEDDEINDYFISHAFPPEEDIRAILAALEEAEEGPTLQELIRAVNLRKGQIDKVLKLLAAADAAPIIQSQGRWSRTPHPYQVNHERIQRLARRRETEWRQMQDYLGSNSCLMEFLARALDDPNAQPCGRCAVCLHQSIVPPTFDESTLHAAIDFERRGEVKLEPRKQWLVDAFPLQGWRGRIPPERRKEEGRALSVWGDMGWARLVREGKQAGRFHDDLVVACTDLIRRRWRPTPPPTWGHLCSISSQPQPRSRFRQTTRTHVGTSFPWRGLQGAGDATPT